MIIPYVTLMIPYITMFIFGLLVLCSWAGWGTAINRYLFPGDRVDLWLRVAWGLAFTLMIGGALNVVSAISPAVIYLFLGIGVLILFADLFQMRKTLVSSTHNALLELRRDPLFAAATFLVCSMLTIIYSGAIANVQFNGHDDYHAYFVFPEKMLQTGTLGPDPYSERRILSLGGVSFLQAMILSVGDVRNLHIMDPGLGTLLTAGLLFGLGRQVGISKWGAVLIFFVFLVVPPPIVNTTSVVTGLSLFLALFRTLYWVRFTSYPSVSTSAIIGLLASGLCSLKSSHIPACVLFVAINYVFYFFSAAKLKRRVLSEAFLTASFTVLFLFPWMISMYQSNGTLLYPILGRGFHGSVYGIWYRHGSDLMTATAIKRLAKMIFSIQIAPFFLVGVAFLTLNHRTGEDRGAPLSFFIAAAVSVLILTVVGDGCGTYRFLYSFVFSAILLLMIVSLAKTGAPMRWTLPPLTPMLVTVLAAGMLMGDHWSTLRVHYQAQIESIWSGLKDYPLSVNRKRYSLMQHAIPKGETVLTRLRHPFVLDFVRNRIYIVDYPGGSSPPPGMPFFQGGEALADYLVGQSIRYIAYSYKSEANFSEEKFKYRLELKMRPWVLSQVQHTFDFQKNLVELGQTRKRIYDDGEAFVLDLQKSTAKRISKICRTRTFC